MVGVFNILKFRNLNFSGLLLFGDLIVALSMSTKAVDSSVAVAWPAGR